MTIVVSSKPTFAANDGGGTTAAVVSSSHSDDGSAHVAAESTSGNALRAAAIGDHYKLPSASVHYARSRDYHVRHIQISLVLEPKTRSAEGDVTNDIIPLRDGLHAVVLDCGDTIKVNHCWIDGQPAKFQQKQAQLSVSPNSALPRGREIAVRVTYKLTQAKDQGGPNGAEGFQWYGPTPEFPDRHPQFWTQGETTGNHLWFPCYDAPDDKCTSETLTTTPESWTVIGNGTESKPEHDAAHHTRTFRWTLNQPHSSYLISLVGGELSVKTSSWRGKPLLYVCPVGSESLLDPSFGQTPAMLSFYSDRLGVTYPWPKYAQTGAYSFPGGMENVSATTLGVDTLIDSRSDPAVAISIVSHEMAHQWFGDLVTCDEWGDAWLNESFATFFAMLTDEHLIGEDAYMQDVASNLSQYITYGSGNMHAVSAELYATSDDMFDWTHTYAKGAVILHMLRRQLGDDDFFRGLHRYLVDNAYKPVNTNDLIKAFFEETGINLRPFFEQWLWKPGHPILTYTWKYDAAAKSVAVHIKQSQDLTLGIPLYSMPLTIGLIGQNRSDGIFRFKSELSAGDTDLKIPYATEPGAVVIDPDHNLLAEIKSDPRTLLEWASILANSPSSVDRRIAVQNLAPAGSKPTAVTLKLLTDALMLERSPHVSAALLRAIGYASDDSTRSLLRSHAQASNAEIRGAALEALGSLTSTKVDDAMLISVASSDTQPYSVVESALGALATRDIPNALPAFSHQVHSKSLRSRLARAAVSRLVDQPSGPTPRKLVTAAIPLLIEVVSSKLPAPTRDAALRGFRTLGFGNPAVHTALIKALTDPSARIQGAAIAAIVARKDIDAAPALDELSKVGSTPDIRAQAAAAVKTLKP